MSNGTRNQGNPLPSGSASETAQGDPVASDVTTKSHAIRNPLWVIVIGMACFFGVTAIITAWS
jgi:hypothetical protein